MTVIEMATRLGIKITKADPSSQVFERWADRVLEAWFAYHDGNVRAVTEYRGQANAYAI